MPLSARKYEPVSALMEHGRVTGREEDRYTIDIESGPVSAVRAVGCLVEPLIGDLVLVSLDARGRAYILNVLERKNPAAATLDFDRDVVIRSRGGRVGLIAGEGVDIASEADVQLAAKGINVSAARGDVHIDRLSYWGSRLRGRVKSLKLVADTVESFCRRFMSVTEQSFRHVEGTDQLSCDSLHYRAKSLVHLKGEYAKMAAKEDVAINGERINIG